MNSENEMGVTAAVERVVVQVNRLPRVGGYADGPRAGVNRRGGAEVDCGPTPILPAADQCVGVNRLVSLSQSRVTEKNRRQPKSAEDRETHICKHKFFQSGSNNRPSIPQAPVNRVRSGRPDFAETLVNSTPDSTGLKDLILDSGHGNSEGPKAR